MGNLCHEICRPTDFCDPLRWGSVTGVDRKTSWWRDRWGYRLQGRTGRTLFQGKSVSCGHFTDGVGDRGQRFWKDFPFLRPLSPSLYSKRKLSRPKLRTKTMSNRHTETRPTNWTDSGKRTRHYTYQAINSYTRNFRLTNLHLRRTVTYDRISRLEIRVLFYPYY